MSASPELYRSLDNQNLKKKKLGHVYVPHYLEHQARGRGTSTHPGSASPVRKVKVEVEVEVGVGGTIEGRSRSPRGSHV